MEGDLERRTELANGIKSLNIMNIAPVTLAFNSLSSCMVKEQYFSVSPWLESKQMGVKEAAFLKLVTSIRYFLGFLIAQEELMLVYNC